MADILDEELEKGLRQAKKKPRNFAAICKGTKLLKLIVKKKPIKQPEIMAAKSEVQGNATVTGICIGDGDSEIAFRVEGEELSIKIQQMREYISDQTKLAIKPRFEFIQSAQIEKKGTKYANNKPVSEELADGK